MLRAIEKDRRYVAGELGVPFGDPYVLGTPDPDSRPYHPTRLTREFKSFCKMNGFEMTFHDLRHTFASMMIAGGTDVRTVASYLGHSNVAMTLNTYAEVDPDAKLAAVDKIGEGFDMDLDIALPPQARGARFHALVYRRAARGHARRGQEARKRKRNPRFRGALGRPEVKQGLRGDYSGSMTWGFAKPSILGIPDGDSSPKHTSLSGKAARRRPQHAPRRLQSVTKRSVSPPDQKGDSPLVSQAGKTLPHPRNPVSFSTTLLHGRFGEGVVGMAIINQAAEGFRSCRQGHACVAVASVASVTHMPKRRRGDRCLNLEPLVDGRHP